MNQSEKRRFLIQSLLKEKPEYRDLSIPAEPESQRQLLRGLMNIRTPQNANADFLKTQDEYLQAETAAKGITDIDDLTPIQQGLYLWQGDITTLKCDAIVNAANSGMTGCYIPNHRCIDNAIHTFAGVELRLSCEELMEQQGYPEPTGQAKITPGIIKYPFWQMTAKNPNAIYACINQGQAACPQEIERQSICIDADIGYIVSFAGSVG